MTYSECPLAPRYFVWVVSPLGGCRAFRPLHTDDVRDVISDIHRFVQLEHGQGDLGGREGEGERKREDEGRGG